jgi:hypothetical protein
VDVEIRPLAETRRRPAGGGTPRDTGGDRHDRVPVHLGEDRKAASLRLEPSAHGQVAHVRVGGPRFPLVLTYSWWSPSFGSGWVQCMDLDLRVEQRDLIVSVRELTDRDHVGFLALEFVDPVDGGWFNLRTHRAFADRRSWLRPATAPS